MSMDWLKTLLNKQFSLPQPIEYLKSVIREDTSDRTNAFLSVSAGMILITGFMFIIVAITLFDKKLTAEFVAINAALVTLATLNRVDGKPPQPKLINNDEKKEDKK